MPRVDVARVRAVDEEVLAQRQYQIDAIVVRIMKTRNRLQHAALVSEACSHIRLFQPDPVMIKKRIENLIEREYLERDSSDRSYYVYKA